MLSSLQSERRSSVQVSERRASLQSAREKRGSFGQDPQPSPGTTEESSSYYQRRQSGGQTPTTQDSSSSYYQRRQSIQRGGGGGGEEDVGSPMSVGRRRSSLSQHHEEHVSSSVVRRSEQNGQEEVSSVHSHHRRRSSLSPHPAPPSPALTESEDISASVHDRLFSPQQYSSQQDSTSGSSVSRQRHEEVEHVRRLYTHIYTYVYTASPLWPGVDVSWHCAVVACCVGATRASIVRAAVGAVVC